MDFSKSVLKTIPQRLDCGIAQMDACFLALRDQSFDLSFTCAVLVHVPYENILKAVREICRVTSQYVLILEYWDTQRVIKDPAPWCFRHNYPEIFEHEGFSVLEQKPLLALIGLFLFKRS